MVSDLDKYYSHPDKLLIKHIDGVRSKVELLTDSRLAQLISIFHDFGKLNPNFQKKLFGISNGYSNHAYLSAFVFFCTFAGSVENQERLRLFLSWDTIKKNDIISISVLIAKHHSNIPDFEPSGDSSTILSKEENCEVFKLVNSIELHVEEYLRHYFNIGGISNFLNNPKVQFSFKEKLVFQDRNNKYPLDFFLDHQWAFANLIQADKADAANFDDFIGRGKKDIEDFCNKYSLNLDNYLSNLNQSSELNKLRTKIRVEAIENLQKNISKCRVFELTAPTGSGKTLMLLSLASKIIKETGSKRIIYGLPFLSITEQVEEEVLKIFKELKPYIQRIDSKSENNRFDEIQDQLDNNPNEALIDELNLLEFQENTFAYPFVITTFVRFFETLLSNRNSELLKLPNFSNCVFLLDEIQSLPPRLYGFFVAYLTKFCKKFNSYAIVSTATQPNFKLPENNDEAHAFFVDYEIPKPLLPLSFFDNDLFNRYVISKEDYPIDLETLKEKIQLEDKSILVILSTIDDTKNLYSLLLGGISPEEEILLLNTHFTPNDRKEKISLAKSRLLEKKKVIVISTQLIEAGVDIDFPVVYRDFTTVASIVQSAGRCNRNGDLDGKGNVHLFKLESKGKIRSELLYRGRDKDLLNFTRQAFIKNSYQEKELLEVQKSFFDKIKDEWIFAKHWQNNPNLEFDFMNDIRQCMYNKIGKFQLIDKQIYGEEVQYYVPENEIDNRFELLLKKQDELIILLKTKHDISIIKIKKNEIKALLKQMANRILQIHLKENQVAPQLANERSYYNLYKLSDKCYSYEKGIDLNGGEFIL